MFQKINVRSATYIPFLRYMRVEHPDLIRALPTPTDPYGFQALEDWKQAVEAFAKAYGEEHAMDCKVSYHGHAEIACIDRLRRRCSILHPAEGDNEAWIEDFADLTLWIED